MSLKKKLLLLEASNQLLLAWFCVRYLAFSRYSKVLGIPQQGEQCGDASSETAPVEEVHWAIKAASRPFGLRFTCLMQAMAGKAMLNRRGVPNALVLGTKFNRDGFQNHSDGIKAHAWLRVGDNVIVGAETRADYIPVTSYMSGKGPQQLC